MSRDQQQVLSSGLLGEVRIGRNEGGLQHFHRWLDRLVRAPDVSPLAEVLAGG